MECFYHYCALYFLFRNKQKIRTLHQSVKSSDYSFLVGRGGFEPPKSLTADLQSAPFGHSGTYPHYGAGGRTRTPDLLITNQLLYQLSYTSLSKLFVDLSRRLLEYNTTTFPICQHFFSIFLKFFYFIFYRCF